MANPLIWPTQYFFYPIGNTSAVCLTRDLPPDESANILLLGCGDPRNILYTVFSEPQKMERRLDFTCCDFDPGVLSRNVLLFTMIADQHPRISTVWNIFFHIYLDQASHLALIEHCKKLVEVSGTLQQWNASSYGRFVKMCTEHTLMELRRHWSLYISLQSLPRSRLRVIYDAFDKFKLTPKDNMTSSAQRSAGPLVVEAMRVCAEQFGQYRKTGVTLSDPDQITAANLLNPTFVYSQAGEGCCVHYGTDPLIPFHFAALFGNAKRTIISVNDLINAARTEFNVWCSAFHLSILPKAANPPVVRFFLGEATFVCRAFRSFSTNGTHKTTIPVSQWKAQTIQLNANDYVSDGAPTMFNAIDTSNLDDHIGLLNILISALPLLTPAGVLYAESLLFAGKDAPKDFTHRLCADITVIGLLLGICPVDYLSGFTTRSNIHELMMSGHPTSSQFHQVTTWKSPSSGDVIVDSIGGGFPPTFDPYQLGMVLYEIYQKLFGHEDARNSPSLNEGNEAKAIGRSNIIHYIRESFVLFLVIIRDRNRIPRDQWIQIMDRFITILHQGHLSDPSAMDTLAYNDLCANLHYHGVHTVQFINEEAPKIGRFSHWDRVPPLVRIVLTVPREKLSVLNDPSLATPGIQCHVMGSRSLNIFSSIHVVFGRATPMGTKSNPWVAFEEDHDGRGGTMPLLVFFTMPAWLLTDIEPMGDLEVTLSVQDTLLTARQELAKKLGPFLTIFSASLLDEDHVQVLPEPEPTKKIYPPPQSPFIPNQHAQIGNTTAAAVEFDDQCELVESFTCRVSVDDNEAKSLFGLGATPQIEQISPCVVRLRVGNHAQNVVYPFPILGTQHRLRLARKSLWIEIIVPVSGQFKPGGMKAKLFPVVGIGSACLNPWNVHRLNLSRLPVVDKKTNNLARWLNGHLAAEMSTRERSLLKKDNTDDVLASVKQTIYRIFVQSSGTRGGPARRMFNLVHKETNNCDTVVFINDLRFDLHSHTIICDAYLLSLIPELLLKIERSFRRLVADMESLPLVDGEIRAWKLLLPALVERCRTSWKHGANCEYQAQKMIPLADVMEVDPLCSCGKGKDVEGMLKTETWSKLTPYVTRIALSPLFGVSYLETIGRDETRYKCSVCRGKGKPKLMKCAVCKKTRYCSTKCQKEDWKAHKTRCKKFQT